MTRSSILPALLLALACASGGPSGDRPRAALAETRDAQTAYREIRRLWFGADASARRRLEQPIKEFLARHGDDARAPSVQTYLAWIYVDKGELDEAQKLVRKARSSASPAVRDFATVAEAAILVAQKQALRALELLNALDRKVIDPEERLVYGEQWVNAAFAARRWQDALVALERWISDAPAHSQDDVQRIAVEMLESVPVLALERRLGELDRVSLSGEQSPGQVWLRRAVRQRLTKVALAKRDYALARRLLDSSPASIRSGESGQLLVRLASSGALTPLVAGRSLGLVLGVRSAEARRRSASVAAGMTRALGLPDSESRPGAVRLLIRDDAGTSSGTEQALAELAAEGAAILVAGVDDESAERALAYAEAQRIPVLVLREPQKEPTRFGFVLGSSEAAERAALGAELETRGLTRVAEVGPNGAPCDAVPARAGEPRFPIASWRRERVDAITLFTDPGCALDVEAELVRARLSPTLFCGLECGELALAPSSKLEWYGVQAGRFPTADRGSLPGAQGGPALAQAPLGFYEALGHDAAVLASAALADFPLERVDDTKEVVELHERAERNLAAASAELWSSDAAGFGGARRLPRKLAVIGLRGHAP